MQGMVDGAVCLLGTECCLNIYFFFWEMQSKGYVAAFKYILWVSAKLIFPLLKYTCHFMLGSAGKTYLHRVQSKFFKLPSFQLSNKLDFQFSIPITCI